MKRALIIANGAQPDHLELKKHLATADLSICADGAIKTLLSNGLRPSFLVGDFDSSTDQERAELSPHQVLHRPDQNSTDLDKCLAVALEQEATEVHILGALGGRLDHELSNLSSATAFSAKFEIFLHQGRSWGRFLYATTTPLTRTFTSFPGQLVSLCSFSGVQAVTTAGLRYPLNAEPLLFGQRFGLSNVALQQSFQITIVQGTLFVFFPDCLFQSTKEQ